MIVPFSIGKTHNPFVPGSSPGGPTNFQKEVDVPHTDCPAKGINPCPIATTETLMKLLIRNLARTTTQAAIQAAFEAHGTVQSTSLVMDKDTGRSKGFAFVHMPKAGEAKAAMKQLNGSLMDEKKIRVKKAEVGKKETGRSTDS